MIKQSKRPSGLTWKAVLTTSDHRDSARLLFTARTGPHWSPLILLSSTLTSLVLSVLQRAGSCDS